jgi:hypothetical protein
MRMKRWFVAVLLSTMTAPLARAQRAEPSVVRGSVVRVRAPAIVPTRIQGTVTQVDEAFLFIRVGPDDAPMKIARESIARLHVREGQRGKFWKGALIGTGVGVAAALLSGVYEDGGEFCIGYECVLFASLFTVPVGFVVGGVTGSFFKTDRWIAVRPNLLRMSPAPELWLAR